MALWKQLLVTLVVLCAGVAGLAAYVPASLPWLAWAGVLEPLQRIGLVPAVVGDAAGDRRGGSGGGPVMVVATAARDVALNDVVAAIGSARSVRAVVVQAEVDGQITASHVTAGQAVDAGQLMVELDSEAAQIALDRAALILSDARVTSARVAQLQARGAATDLQVQDAELALKTAELQAREAEFDVRRHRIIAPIAGSLGLLAVGLGDRLSEGDEITRVEDRSSLIVDFRVPERVVSRLRLGAPVGVTALADPDQPLEGRITALDNRVDEASRTLLVQAAIGNADDRLRAGMAFAITLTFQGAAYPAVDPLAIQWGSRGAFIWVVREGKAMTLPIRILQRNSDAVLIEAALARGDLVVTEGVQSLRPGAEVGVAAGSGAALDPVPPGKG